MFQTELFKKAADAIRQADTLLITAGAGMGVDSGLPDFRGDQGFWKAYPAYEKLGLSFADMANPHWFSADPEMAWGFYGHRRNLYRKTNPHKGFSILKGWADRASQGHFVFTSNVDGQFQRAGFDPSRVVEAHGAIDFMQCTVDCGVGIFPGGNETIDVDEKTFRVRGKLPKCTNCGALARPNIMMFGDYGWKSSRTYGQRDAFLKWSKGLNRPRLVVVECGAGTSIPTVRRFSEEFVTKHDGLLIRINVREDETPLGHIGLPFGARPALEEIDRFLK